ncbi:hypothetical protein DZK27_05020 [Rhodobacteraceae bacterium 63075]|nr:hypothetical protein DZK27_05020 [Rhodobacteraceae bacterium 63075]
MLFTKRATVAVAAGLHIAFSGLAMAEPPSIDARLLDALHHWIDNATDLPAADKPANIVFADPQDLAQPGEMASMIGSHPRGLYEPATATITLVRPWSTDNLQDVAVLLHELVHHRQGGKHFYCEAAKEYDAYEVQKDWLAQRDLPLDVNWIGIVLASSCAARDVHP